MVDIIIILYFIQITEELLSDYQQVSIMAVYWEKTIQDEAYHEYREYETVMTTAENKLYQVLCTQYTGVHQYIDSFVERSVMHGNYRDANTRTIRSIRDFVIARDTAKIFDILRRKYDFISTHSWNFQEHFITLEKHNLKGSYGYF